MGSNDGTQVRHRIIAPEDLSQIYRNCASQTDVIKVPDTRTKETQTSAVRQSDTQTQTDQEDLVETADAEVQATQIVTTTDSDTQTEIAPDAVQSHKSLSWTSFRESKIPAFVKDITFTVDAKTLSLEDEHQLQSQFPGVFVKLVQPDPSIDPESRSIAFMQPADLRTTSSSSPSQHRSDTLQGADKSLNESPLRKKDPKDFTQTEMTVQDSEESSEQYTTTIPSDTEGGARSVRQSQIPASGSNTSSILDFADQLGMNLTNEECLVTMSTYSSLRQTKQADLYEKKFGSVENYLNQLLTLYILTYKRKQKNLAYTVLLSFQTTICSRKRSMPTMRMTLRAFKFLPSDAPLCQWLAIVYCFLWPIRKEGSYNAFVEDYDDFDLETKARLLYEVTWHRDPYVYGGDAGVFSSFCDVHDHAKQTLEQVEMCRCMKKKTQINEQALMEKEADTVREELLFGFRKIDPENITYERSDAPATKLPVTNKKRKAEGSPENIDERLVTEESTGMPIKKRRGRPPGSGKKQRAGR
ncbi:hypothetical protein NX059_011981 [Plenodomus lindquistii]|nr:hypothetical protein NX059_011981 [Plenodomus lindquistii]